jgi:hypothetical protein
MTFIPFGTIGAVLEHKAAESKPVARSLSTIARDVRANWPNVYFGAVPYLDAMRQLDSVRDDYGCDSGRSVVLYFLSNATTWRGEHARRIKAELKALLGSK